MFCFKCGSEIPEESVFCMKCGASMPTDLQQSNDHSKDQKKTNDASVKTNDGLEISSEETKKNVMSCDLLGFTLTYDENFDEYMDIRKRFLQEAIEAAKKMSDNYQKKYEGVNGYLQYADDDAHELISDAYKMGLKILVSKGLYDIDITDIEQAAKLYVMSWDSDYEFNVEEIEEIRNTEFSDIEYRERLKQGRGRVIGGGFGLSGAAKGMLTAGVINATTGALFSMANAFGNASSSKKAKELEKALYRDEIFVVCMCEAIYTDVLNVHLAIIDLLNERLNKGIIKYFTDEAKKESKKIYDNLKEGIIPDNQKAEVSVKALNKWPYELKLYEYIIDTFGDENGEIEAFAQLFGVYIKPLKLKSLTLHTSLEHEEVGDYLKNMKNRMSENFFYNKLQGAMKLDYTYNIHLACDLNDIDLARNQVYVMTEPQYDHVHQIFENATQNYFQSMDNEDIVVVFDNTGFSKGKEGFIISNKRMVNYKKFADQWEILTQDIKSLYMDGKNYVVNDKKVDTTFMKASDRVIVFHFIQYVIECIQLEEALNQPEQLNVDLIDSITRAIIKDKEKSYEAEPSNLTRDIGEVDTREELDSSDESNVSDKDISDSDTFFVEDLVGESKKDKIIDLMQRLSGYNFRKTLLFYVGENDNIAKKMEKAANSYVCLEDGEEILMLFDNTVFGSGKEGFVFTNRSLQYKNQQTIGKRIELTDIKTIAMKKNELIINDDSIYLALLPKNQHDVFKVCIAMALVVLQEGLEKSKYCTACGDKIKDQTKKFCKKCGKALR